jgi:predicted phage terminase large subunit-like protein
MTPQQLNLQTLCSAAWRITPAAMANRLTDGDWQWPDHLDLLSLKLAEVKAGRLKRLIVTMPPQNGKSELCSKWFPVNYLDEHPSHRFILVSYGAEYAESWGRRVRNLIDEHSAQLRVKVAKDNGAAGEWETTDGGGMVSVGIGGSVTGRRANVLLVDDPFKNAEEANSETHRQKVWDFYLSAAYTRLTPDGAIIIIMTRWNESDLVGRLDAEERAGGEKWERINLPAIAEENDPMGRQPGEPLWPQRWPLETLHRIKRAVGSYFWAALYMQRPAPPEGNYFKRSWFNIIEPGRVPRLVKRVRSWDLAATVQGENGNNDPDWLTGCKMGVTEDGRYVILGMRRERETPQGVERTIKQDATVDGRDVAIRIEQEGAASGKIVASYYTKLLDGYDARFETIPKSSKFTRSGPFNAACERGDVFLVAGDWVGPFLDEAAAFPHGKHDDQIDSAVGAYTYLSSDPSAMDGQDWNRIVSYDGVEGLSPRELLLRQMNGQL